MKNNNSKTKVVILAPYSHPSACGIWKRVHADAKALLSEGYEVHIFTSNIIKGTSGRSSNYENFEGLHIHRFKVWFSLGGTSMFWFFLLKLIKLKPDIIHTHGYRHPHSLSSLILGKLLRKKVILTTHAPFAKDSRRSWHLKVFDKAYDTIFAWWELRLYNKVIRISKWEEKYLIKLGSKNSEYIPNGIEKEFIEIGTKLLNLQTFKPSNQVLYMGRVDPVKRVEWLITAAQNLPQHNFKIHGPIQGYAEEILNSKSEILNNLQIQNRKYSKEEFIDELEESDIYVLPSIREALGITLLEAMGTGRIVIASNALGPKDFIIQGKNGFIVKNEDELVEAIEYVYNNFDKMTKLRFNAVETVKQYDVEVMNEKLVNLYRSIEPKMSF